MNNPQQSEQTPLIHIGYHKTGSTWLQENVFRNFGSNFQEILLRPEVIRNIVTPRQLHYDSRELLLDVQHRSEEICAEKLVPLISHERLSGNPYSGGFDSVIIANRIFELFPSARVLIVVREQQAHLASIYAEYVRQGGVCTLDQFVNPPTSPKIPLFSLKYLEFHHLIKYYIDHYGRENVLTLPYEMLAQDHLMFVAEILRFSGAKSIDNIDNERIRERRTEIPLMIERCLNSWFYRDSCNPAAPWKLPLAKSIPTAIERFIPRTIRRLGGRRTARVIQRMIGSVFLESNTRLAPMVHWSPASFGYMSSK